MNGINPDAADDRRRDDDRSTPSRRRILRATASTAIGGAGLGTAPGAASATDFTGCDEWLEAPAEYPEIDLTSGNPTAANLEALESEDAGESEAEDASADENTDEAADADRDEAVDADEIVVFVHGWLGRDSSTDQASTLEQALEAADYDVPVIAATWAADTHNYWRAESETETAGRRLAAWLEADRIDLENATVRLVGHSLGGRVCLETLTALDGTVDGVALVGTAADDDAVCTDGQYAYGIATAAEAVFNYHSEADDTVCYGYDLQSLASGLGCGGSDCDGGWFADGSGATPDNYTDVDVTDAVDDHCAYTKPDVGCVPRLVDDFEGD